MANSPEKARAVLPQARAARKLAEEDGLTERQRRFVEAYVASGNVSKAAIEAGYSARTAGAAGCRLLKTVKVAEAIAEKQRKIAEKLEITHEMIWEGLLKEATREGDGANHSARVSAWGQLGKFKGMAEKREISFDLTNLTDEQLRILRTISISE